MPLLPARGTSVCRISPDSGKKSIAPERTCDSMSVSPPSWLLGNTWMSTRPLVSALIFSAASLTRIVLGCVTGMLLAHFSWNSAAWPKAGRMPVAASAAAPPTVCTNLRRSMLMVLSPRGCYVVLDSLVRGGSVHAQSTVGDQRGAVDIRRLGRNEKRDRAGDFLRFRGAIHHVHRFDPLSMRFVGEYVGDHRRHGRTRCNGVDGNAPVGERAGGIFRQRQDCAFARGVSGRAGQPATAQTRDAGDGADAPARRHVLRRFANAQEGADHVVVIHAVKGGGVEVHERRHVRAAGTRDQRIESAERFHRVRECGDDRGFVGDIELEREMLGARCRDHGAHTGPVAVDGGHAIAARGEFHHGGGADAAGGAGHDGGSWPGHDRFMVASSLERTSVANARGACQGHDGGRISVVAAATTPATVTRDSSSSGFEYPDGMRGAPRRRMRHPVASAAAAAISAPKPPTCTASCTTSRCPVRAVEPSTISRSHGHRVRRSITSAWMPAAASSVAAATHVGTAFDQLTMVTSPPSHKRRATPSGTFVPATTSPSTAHSSLCSM